MKTSSSDTRDTNIRHPDQLWTMWTVGLSSPLRLGVKAADARDLNGYKSDFLYRS